MKLRVGLLAATLAIGLGCGSVVEAQDAPAWVDQFGTTAKDESTGIALWPSGELCVGYWHDKPEGWQAFVRQYDVAHQPVWTHQVGSASTGHVAVWGVATDSQGHCYATGSTSGVLAGASGSGGSFLRKYALDGSVVWTRQFDGGVYGAGPTRPVAISVDGSGAVYVTGETKGTFPGTSSDNGGYDAVLVKFDAAGTVLWARQFGTAGDELPYAVATSPNGNVLVAGYTPGSLGPPNEGWGDAFVRAYDQHGGLLWTTQFGTTSDDAAQGVAVDSQGFVYVTGYTGGGHDAFLAKLNPGGTTLWRRQIGSYRKGVAVSVAPNGLVYVGVEAPGTDPDLRVYDGEGQLLKSVQVGTPQTDNLLAMVAGHAGVAYLAGRTSGTFAGQSNAGLTDAFVLGVDVSIAAAAPSNDNLDESYSLAEMPSTGFLDGSLEGATLQSGEPGTAGARSAWFTFVAPASERVVFEAASPDPSIRLTVYIDATPHTPPTFADLVRVAGNPREVDVAPSYDKLVFETTAGTAYFVAIEAWSSDGAAYRLRWRRAELARLLWQHDSGAITIWTVDGAGTLVSHHRFGPFSGWQAVKIAVGPDGRTRVLWRHTSGMISIWTLDTDGNLAGSVVTGPFAEWTASDMVIRSDGDMHLAWTHTNGSLALWKLSPNGSFASSVVYGPYSGWRPLGIAVDSDLTRRILWQGKTGAVGLWLEPLPYGSPSNFGSYGPFTDRKPVDLAAGLADGSARVLVRHSSGAVGLWRQLPNGTVTSTLHGPFPGWEGVAIAVSRSRDGHGDVAWLDKASRVLWRHTDGTIALWKTGEMGDLRSSFTYGPFPGWTVIDVTAGPE